MHLSLKGSLDRQPLVDRIGDKLLPTYPGAAAAYSLRALNGDANNVVRVRRASDDVERDFTAREVSSGDMVNWVNVGKDYEGHATFIGSSPRVTLDSSFTLDSSESWSLKFGFIMGSSTNMGIIGSTASINTGFFLSQANAFGLTTDTGAFTSLFITGSMNKGQYYDIELNNDPITGVEIKIDGVVRTSNAKIISSDVTLNRFSPVRGRAGNRVIDNFRVDLNGDGTLDYSYAGDGIQASNWVDRMGSGNDGTPSGLTAYNNEFTEGFVETWYDQSGEGNDAVQTVIANQPKIVDAGALVDGGMVFDGVDDFLGTSLVPPNSATMISVADWYVAGTTQIIVGARDSLNERAYVGLLSTNVSAIGNMAENLTGSVIGVSQNDVLLFGIYDAGVRLISTNGIEVSNSDGVLSTNTTQGMSIGAFNDAGTNGTFTNGKISEVIIYPSNQSTNRDGIETDINDYYNIY